MRVRPLPRPKRSAVIAMTFVVIGAVVVLGIVLALTDTLSAHGVVYGSFHVCRMTSSGCNPQSPRYDPVAGARIQFVRVDSHRKYVAVTDSRGDYSISLPAGEYSISAYFADGPREIAVAPDQRTEADFHDYYLPQ